MTDPHDTARWQDEDTSDESLSEKYVFLDYVVEKGQEALRIDKYLMLKTAGVTRNKIQQGIAAELVLVNAHPVKANYKIRPGDHILAYAFRSTIPTEIIPEPLPLRIVYEDDDILVVHKEAGMVVHPGHGNSHGTLVNAVAYHLQQQNLDSAELPRVGLVHRIDKDTSGLLVIGKSEKALNKLSAQFAAHTVERSYVALVWGDVKEERGTIDTMIARHERNRKIFDAYPHDEEKGKTAITHYEVLEHLYYVTLLRCRLETGRTHQIRVHMKHIGHPLFADAAYGGDRILKGTLHSKYKSFVENCFQCMPRQALHARTLGFVNPGSGEWISFESDLPEDFSAVLAKWRSYIRARIPET